MTAAGWLRRAPGLHLGAARELQNSLGAALRLRTWLSGSTSLQAWTSGCWLLTLTCAVTRAESYWADCVWHAASLVCVLPSFARARLDTSKCVWLGFILFKLQIAGSCCHKNRGKFAWLPETSAYPNYLLFSAVWNSSTYLGEKQRCREQERATARALRLQLNLLNTAPNVELHICLGWCPWDDQNRRNSGR